MAELQRRLMSAPILRHPDLKRPFVLKTDACQTGFGGILCQRDDDGREYVVRLTPATAATPERGSHPALFLMEETTRAAPEILMGLRAAKQETTGFSPYFLVFGKEANIPL